VAVSATVTPLFAPRAVEADLRRRVAELERDKEELVQRWLRANDTCERQRLMIRALTRLVRNELPDRLVVLELGVLLGLVIAKWLGP
jgi:hypothetical protein